MMGSFTLLGWLFLIASWIVPKLIYPMPEDYRKKHGLGLILSIVALVCFVFNFFTHVHGPGCNH
jgi:hypothetical protein